MKTIIKNPLDRLIVEYKELNSLNSKKTLLFPLGYSKVYQQLDLESEHHEDFTDCILPFIKDDYNIIFITGSITTYNSDKLKNHGNGIILIKLEGDSLILKEEFAEHRESIFNIIENVINPLNITLVVDFSCRSTFTFAQSYVAYNNVKGIEQFKGGVRIKRNARGAKDFLELWNSHEPGFNLGGYIGLSMNLYRCTMYILNRLGKSVHIFSPDPRYSKLYRENLYTFAADDMYYPITEDFKVDVIKHGYVTQSHLSTGLFNNPLLKFKDKKMDLLFCGTVSSERNESRIKMYEDYIMNIADGPHSLYYKKIKGNELKAPSTYEHILNNKFHKGIEVTYDECTKQFIRHKYSFVPSPIINNSYHRRIAQAVSLNNLPLVAHDYDPLNKQLPSKFNDILRVKNSSEINQKIKYFNQNPEEAQEIIDEIKQYMGFNDLNNKDSIKKYILKKLKL